MHAWSPEQVAEGAGARLVLAPPADRRVAGPRQAVIDSRTAGPGDLFVGLVGEHADGGRFAAGALAAGAWGVLVTPEHAEAARRAGTNDEQAILAADDPLAALQRLATAWRRALACPVIGVTGSVGKTTTKDLLAAMLTAGGVAVVANERNLNTEIGLPLTVLRAPAGTQALVLEMGMRGVGQIAELAAIAEPDVGVITALGPVHLEQLGTIEAIAAEKAALVQALTAGAGTAVLPAGEALLAPHRRDDLTTVTFGDAGSGADVTPADLAGLGLDAESVHVRIDACAALAAARAVGAQPRGPVALTLSEMRGQRLRLADDITLIEDCYNANPVSMRAALDDLAARATGPGRLVAVLGDMRELGPDEVRHHTDIGEHARAAGVDLLVAVGPLSAAYAADHAVADAAQAAALVPGLLRRGDTVLVKASRGVGLEAVTAALRAAGTAKLPAR
ncbi:MAG: UDP-N-acetylmuramoyl-tripeptide--D-alanyl-D-alanine ligase [Solirubrobacterales bacterium]|nr:UDP-N-acetylmuramoyl-tripeptide--D-alanyl-D-alanine ligase [Solirubrobacterales bacterium]